MTKFNSVCSNCDDYEKIFFDETDKLKKKISKECTGKPEPFVISALVELLALNIVYVNQSNDHKNQIGFKFSITKEVENKIADTIERIYKAIDIDLEQ